MPKFDPESPVHQDQAYDNALNLNKSRGLGPPRDRLSEAVHIHDVNMVSEVDAESKKKWTYSRRR